MHIQIITETSELSTVTISLKKNGEHPHLVNCRKLAIILSNYKGNTSHEKYTDEGDMYIVEQGNIGD